MDYKHIILKNDEEIHTLTLNRPSLRNAFNDEMIAEITDAFERRIAGEPGRAVVIRGAGQAFCAGGDMNWMRRMKDASREENLADAKRLDRMFHAVYLCDRAALHRQDS
ncbi:MAG: enoyl-CoA hydratase/isomerase family protein, partial [Leptonema illini]